MYPYKLFLGLDLYIILITLGVIACLVCFRVYGDKLNVSAKLQNFCMLNGVASVIVGYLFAVLFQAVYNAIESGKFEIVNSTGATFYGGLIGGAATFLLVYFLIGRLLFKDRQHIKNFFKIANIAVCSICVAHSLGRIGCLMAGCCYGKVTDSPLGIYMVALGAKVYPVQLYEAIYLALLFVTLTILLFKGFNYNLSIYLIAYGVWRFIIEYLRGDDRGATSLSFLSPSQLTALVMVVFGVVLLIIMIKKGKKPAEVAQ